MPVDAKLTKEGMSLIRSWSPALIIAAVSLVALFSSFSMAAI